MPIAIVSENDDLTGPAEFEADLGHVETGLGRLIERWKADVNPNFGALVSSVLEEIQEFENAAWIVIYGRMIDYAENAQLDMLGRIVGQDRSGLSDDAYRARIRVRIRINQSIGTPKDVIAVLRMLDPSRFRFTEFGAAAFRVDYLEPPSTAAVGSQIPAIVRDTRAAGVSGLVTMPVDRVDGRDCLHGSAYDPTLNVSVGHSSSYDTTTGGLHCHETRA